MFSYQLLARFNKGERKAQNEVWKKYFPQVFSNIRILTEGSAEAEDMALEIMEKLILREKPFESLDHIRGYLFKAVRNKCKNNRDRSESSETKSEHFEQYYKDIAPEDLDDAESIAALRSQVFKVINELPTKCREVFLMYHVQGMKNPEIAREKNISVKAVEKHKTHAFKKLRMKLGSNYRFILSILFL